MLTQKTNSYQHVKKLIFELLDKSMYIHYRSLHQMDLLKSKCVNNTLILKDVLDSMCGKKNSHTITLVNDIMQLYWDLHSISIRCGSSSFLLLDDQHYNDQLEFNPTLFNNQIYA